MNVNRASPSFANPPIKPTAGLFGQEPRALMRVLPGCLSAAPRAGTSRRAA